MKISNTVVIKNVRLEASDTTGNCIWVDVLEQEEAQELMDEFIEEAFQLLAPEWFAQRTEDLKVKRGIENDDIHITWGDPNH